MDHVQLGPVGGTGGRPFAGYEIPAGARLTAVHVYADWVVNAIRFDFVQADGNPVSRAPIGGLGGTHNVFYLEEEEYITGISGRCGWYIDGVRFHTNKRTSDFFGGAGGERDFALLGPQGYELAGIFGRSDWYIDAVGLNLRTVGVREGIEIGNTLEAEALAELTSEEAEEALDEMIVAISAELAAEVAARHAAGAELRGEAVLDLAADVDAMSGELLDAAEAAALEAAVLDEIVGALELALDAEQNAALDEETLDMAVVQMTGRVAGTDDVAALQADALLHAVAALEDMAPGDEETVDMALDTRLEIDPVTGRAYATVTALASEVDAPDGDEPADDEEYDASWVAMDGESEALAAAVVVRRESVSGPEELDALEEAAAAEAVTDYRDQYGLEPVDVAIYSQVVEEDASGRASATVLAVAAQEGGRIEAGDEAKETSVMVTGPVDSDDDLADLEEEAVGQAIEALEEGLGREVEDVEVTLYSGVAEDEGREAYGAVVAIVSAVENGSPDGDTALSSAARSAAVIGTPPREARPRDLQLVEGIGPRIAALLIEHGVYDLADLAATPVERLRAILADGGKPFRLAIPGSWPEQAALGVAGDWAGLATLQKRLKGGR